MKIVTIEADKLGDILVPLTCARCGQDVTEANSTKKVVTIRGGKIQLLEHGDFSIRICKRKQCRRYSWQILFIITAILLLMLAIVYIIIGISKPIISSSLPGAHPEPPLGSPVGGIVAILFIGGGAIYKVLRTGEQDCTCIRKSKSTWLFRFNNDLFADQFAEVNDKNKRQQAEEQRQAEEYQRQQKEAECDNAQKRAEEDPWRRERRRAEEHQRKQEEKKAYDDYMRQQKAERREAQRRAEEYQRQREEAKREEERQRAEKEQQRRFKQAEQESNADNARQPVKDERYYGKVLGLKGRITKEDVKRCYRDLCQQYHPDTVNRAGPEIKELAEKKMKEINEAYAYFEKKYGA